MSIQNVLRLLQATIQTIRANASAAAWRGFMGLICGRGFYLGKIELNDFCTSENRYRNARLLRRGVHFLNRPLKIEERPFNYLNGVADSEHRGNLPSRCRARRCLRAANQLTGHRVGRLAIVEGDLAAHDRVLVALGVLDQTTSTGWQIEHHLRRMQSAARPCRSR